MTTTLTNALRRPPRTGTSGRIADASIEKPREPYAPCTRRPVLGVFESTGDYRRSTWGTNWGDSPPLSSQARATIRPRWTNVRLIERSPQVDTPLWASGGRSGTGGGIVNKSGALLRTVPRAFLRNARGASPFPTRVSSAGAVRYGRENPQRTVSILPPPRCWDSRTERIARVCTRSPKRCLAPSAPRQTPTPGPPCRRADSTPRGRGGRAT